MKESAVLNHFLLSFFVFLNEGTKAENSIRSAQQGQERKQDPLHTTREELVAHHAPRSIPESCNHSNRRCVKPSHLLGSQHALPFIRAFREQRLTSPPHHSRRPQMDFRQACDAQLQRPLWRLQQANYGSCVFAVRFFACIRNNLAQILLHSGRLPMQHALVHP